MSKIDEAVIIPTNWRGFKISIEYHDGAKPLARATSSYTNLDMLRGDKALGIIRRLTRELDQTLRGNAIRNSQYFGKWVVSENGEDNRMRTLIAPSGDFLDFDISSLSRDFRDFISCFMELADRDDVNGLTMAEDRNNSGQYYHEISTAGGFSKSYYGKPGYPGEMRVLHFITAQLNEGVTREHK